MYVCKYACKYVYNLCVYSCISMYAYMHACMHACMHVFMYVCKHVCMYGCMCISFRICVIFMYTRLLQGASPRRPTGFPHIPTYGSKLVLRVCSHRRSFKTEVHGSRDTVN